MNSALLHNQRVVTAAEYSQETHGHRLFCIDKSCKAPVIFVNGSETTIPHFKTTGKNDVSKHMDSCGFFKPLSFEESIKKVQEYQSDLLNQGMKENIVKLNLNKLDPDYEGKQIERDEIEKKEKDPNEIKVKQESPTPNSISSLKSIVKLLTSYEPDILASILVSVKSKKVPLSQIVINQEKAHDLLWADEVVDSMSYFVYGTVENVIRREKVYYISFKPTNNVSFNLVVFDKYFKHFTYRDEQLIGKDIVAWGGLKKNIYKDKNTTEMVIKSNKYLEYLPKQKND
ncbi:hypothetical protein AWM68_17455 [Fictibacillus phosphorivorans]|uniref:Uncharacterized protein n=1 Tax=Fictibacillus phosphorivorans TaxID=1221500 RepID=A0A163S1J0_9BACL|nr:hypothetical protein [Fictibacillus phosphorivorans]KZE67959.1 hypothetical protein AWM68_17455 [Fictibacillus phosphorivorans]